MHQSSLTDEATLIRDGCQDRIMFTLHSITGLNVCYNGLIPLLDGSYKIIGLNAPGRSTKKAAFNSYRDLADIAALKISNFTDKSTEFVVCGYSFGGVLALETVKLLFEKSGRRPKLLFFIDPLFIHPVSPRIWDYEFWLLFTNIIGARSLERIKKNSNFWQLEECDRLSELYECAREKKSTRLPIKWDYKEYLRYFEFIWSMWSSLDGAHMDAIDFNSVYMHCAKSGRDGTVKKWLELLPKNTSVYQIPGNHAEIITPPYAARCAEIINSETARVLS